MTAPPITATCRYCGAVIAWDDLFGWLLRGWQPNSTSGQCRTGHHEPEEEDL